MGRQRSPKYEAGPSLRRYLRVANVLDGHIDTTDVKSMQFSDKEFEQYRLLDGDILLNEGQSRELVGRSSIFRGELPDVCFQNTLIRFRPSKSLSSEFSQRYFQYCLYGGRFIANSKQTTSIAHLGVQRFAQMSIPVPDEDVQLGITRRIAEVEERLEDARTRERALRALKTCAVNETLVRD
jgi:type I restriction enzyme S subunit